jgi:hypothetical protein
MKHVCKVLVYNAIAATHGTSQIIEHQVFMFKDASVAQVTAAVEQLNSAVLGSGLAFVHEFVAKADPDSLDQWSRVPYLSAAHVQPDGSARNAVWQARLRYETSWHEKLKTDVLLVTAGASL